MFFSYGHNSRVSMDGNESIGEDTHTDAQKIGEYMRKGTANATPKVTVRECPLARITCLFSGQICQEAGKEGSIVKIATDRIGFSIQSEVAAHSSASLT